MPETTSFTNGILQDLDAVLNGITLSYSNGLAEDNINKIKLIKRTMFGRCNFDTLKHKIFYWKIGNSTNIGKNRQFKHT